VWFSAAQTLRLYHFFQMFFYVGLSFFFFYECYLKYIYIYIYRQDRKMRVIRVKSSFSHDRKEWCPHIASSYRDFTFRYWKNNRSYYAVTSRTKPLRKDHDFISNSVTNSYWFQEIADNLRNHWVYVVLEWRSLTWDSSPYVSDSFKWIVFHVWLKSVKTCSKA
jgi:hypothetical protein